MALYNGRERIKEDIGGWREAGAQLETRLPRWGTLERLLRHAPGLDGGEDFVRQAEAVRTGRALLADPETRCRPSFTT